MNVADYIDHTVLKPTAQEHDILTLCNEARQYGFYAVCVNACWVPLCKNELKNSNVKLAVVVGFPLGSGDTASKVAEIKHAILAGADEVDMVINIGFAKDGNWNFILDEIKACKDAAGNKILKVIIETCYLTIDEIRKVTEIVILSGADFIKTSTGFGSGGAKLSDIEIMKSTIGNSALKIKASGGIKDYDTALQYVNAGVQRIGTSSGVAIVLQTHNSGSSY